MSPSEPGEDSVYNHPDYIEAAKFVCAPPIRKQEDQNALWEALQNGEIDTVATDHCSFTTAQKRAGRYDFTRIPGAVSLAHNWFFPRGMNCPWVSRISPWSTASCPRR